MKLTPDPEREHQLLETLRASLAAEQREGVHVSDLLSPLRTYWQRVHPLPVTDDEIGYWLAGRGHHYYVVLMMANVAGGEEVSLIDPETGITYSPDLHTLSGEFKTNRKEREPYDEKDAKRMFEHHLVQCRNYAALEGRKEWWLYELFLCLWEEERGVLPPIFRVYKVEFTDKELEKAKRDMVERKQLLEQALETGDHSELPLCPRSICMTWRQGVGTIPICKWWDICKPKGRHPESPVEETKEAA